MAQTPISLDLHVEHLKDRDGIETHITQAPPHINPTAETSEFKKKLEQNLKQSAEHVARLKQILSDTP